VGSCSQTLLAGKSATGQAMARSLKSVLRRLSSLLQVVFTAAGVFRIESAAGAYFVSSITYHFLPSICL
jgi:hypothetical protein